MKYLVLGSTNIDFTYHVSHIVKAGETLASQSIDRNSGGKGANQAAALGKAGADVSFAGKIGKDGLFILEKLQSYGVDTSLTIVSETHMTGQAIIQVDPSGQNCIILMAGGNKAFERDEIEKIIDNFDQGDVIMMQNEINLIGEAMRLAKDRGLYICFNPSPFDQSIMTLPLELVDCFFINEIEAMEIVGEKTGPVSDEDFKRLGISVKNMFPKCSVVLTAGKKGAYYFGPEGMFYSPIVDYPVVDTTGAGDTFSSYFLVSRSLGNNIQKSLDYASNASGLAVSRKGAMEAIPLRSEVF